MGQAGGALVALIDAVLAGAVVAAIAVAMAFFACLFMLVGRLFGSPRRTWLLVALLGVNAVVLVPLWGAAFSVASSDPPLWAQARGAVLLVSAALVLPTLGWYAWCRRRDAAEGPRPRPPTGA